MPLSPPSHPSASRRHFVLIFFSSPAIGGASKLFMLLFNPIPRLYHFAPSPLRPPPSAILVPDHSPPPPAVAFSIHSLSISPRFRHGCRIRCHTSASAFSASFSPVKWLEKDNVRLFSHQIPARKLTDMEGVDFPGECWELDPASLPADLLRLDHLETKVVLNYMFPKMVADRKFWLQRKKNLIILLFRPQRLVK
ncbi:uncharacterized protein LOC120253210 [Dioscorea cayenensis subsp. rotundata]|uniref:Uncharacterized protein LOC120253210 n=1 Tax=Dioscorea cayennensis subsp. rotundata TaxID=55577 RepID=A0AB40AR39_DIOCR|nr:uncharacterized protein LOC120253210 [Dioscorea cayenensis subsp. rotundata]